MLIYDEATDREADEQQLKGMSPLINFFASAYTEQVLLLPTLSSQRAYDFSDGDLTTDQPLLVLACCYSDGLNSLLIRVDDTLNPDFCEVATGLYWAIDVMTNTSSYFDSEALDQSAWAVIRQLSRRLKRFIDVDATTTQAELNQYLQGISI